MLEIIPVPTWAVWFRPAWMVLLLMYWIMQNPERFSLGVAWGSGILLDVLTGTLLGEHALALTIIAYLTIQVSQRMWLYPLWQQSLMVALFSFIYLLLLIWVQGMIGILSYAHFNWFMPLSNALVWPAIILLQEEKHRVIPEEMFASSSQVKRK